MFDLMVAATWSPRFDLNELSNTVASSLEAKGFEAIEPTTILKCLGAVHFGGLKRDQLLALRDVSETDMQKLVERTTGALLRAVDLLSTEFKVHSWDFLPYEAILIVLCYIFSQIEQIAATHVRRIRQWFWRSAFSERYRVGGENFVTKDLEAVMKFVRDNGEPNAYGSSLSADQLVKNAFRSNNSRSRAYILALAARKPRNLTNGATIDTAEALSQFNKKQFHHIYPRAFLRRIGCREDDNVLANICMLAAAENNAVSDSDPNILSACAESCTRCARGRNTRIEPYAIKGRDRLHDSFLCCVCCCPLTRAVGIHHEAMSRGLTPDSDDRQGSRKEGGRSMIIVV